MAPPALQPKDQWHIARNLGFMGTGDSVIQILSISEGDVAYT